MNSSLSFHRISKSFSRILSSGKITSENTRHKLSRDLKSKLVSRRSVKNSAISEIRRIVRTISNLIQKVISQPKKKSVKVKYLCSFNLETGRVCKREKPVSSLLLGQQNSKRTLRWGK